GQCIAVIAPATFSEAGNLGRYDRCKAVRKRTPETAIIELVRDHDRSTSCAVTTQGVDLQPRRNATACAIRGNVFGEKRVVDLFQIANRQRVLVIRVQWRRPGYCDARCDSSIQ